MASIYSFFIFFISVDRLYSLISALGAASRIFL